MRRVVCAVLLVFTSIATAADRDFDFLVQQMESNYGTRKMYIPMLGFVNFLVKVARPAGTRDFKLAVFENVDSDRHPSVEQLDDIFLPRGWKPFIRVVSNRDRERVHIYSRQTHRDHELMITTLERREAVMARVRLNAESLARWVNNPIVMGRSKGHWSRD